MIIGIGVSKKHRTMSLCIKKDALFFLFLRRGGGGERGLYIPNRDPEVDDEGEGKKKRK